VGLSRRTARSLRPVEIVILAKQVMDSARIDIQGGFSLLCKAIAYIGFARDGRRTFRFYYTAS
jgi:hypothetical protein